MSAALDELAKAVAEWRATKGRYQHMPRAWIRQARALAAETPEREICQRLKLEPSKLFPKPRQSRTSLSPSRPPAAGPTPQTATFVELPPFELKPPAEPIRVEIHDRRRSVVIITLPRDIDLAVLVSALRGRS